MISLPNGCRCSEFAVKPKGILKSPGSFDKDIIWQIHYRFYDPSGKVKSIPFRGKINQFKTWKERKDRVDVLIEQEKQRLRSGYNPVKNRTVETGENHDGEISPKTGFIKALRKALELIEVAPETRKDIGYVVNKVEEVARKQKIDSLPTSEVNKALVKSILTYLAKNRPRFTANTYNHYRKYLKILFTEIVENGAMEYNPIKEIAKKKKVNRIRQTLSDDQRVTVDKYLREKYYEMWRFLVIFFHSGGRNRELFRLQGKDVDLKNQKYKRLVKKGKEYREVWTTIKDVALDLWIEVMQKCRLNDYVFSKGLKPGAQPIRADQITKRWYRLVKKKLGITADWNTIRHLNITETIDILGAEDAAKQTAHTSTAMVINVYDLNKEKRQHERLKRVDNKFA